MAVWLKTRTQGGVWLLCLLIVLMSMVSPLCSACDGIGTVHSSLAHTANTMPPSSSIDQCNGVCSCCGFHWLPASEPTEGPIALLPFAASNQKQRLVSCQLAPPFQPPRA